LLNDFYSPILFYYSIIKQRGELMLKKYNTSIEQNMLSLYDSLDEKNRRRYAGLEARRLGRGGVLYISSLFCCGKKQIRKGIQELNSPSCMSKTRIRKSGGGSKLRLDKIKNIDAVFLNVLQEYTAGDPMKEKVKWTNLSKTDICSKMSKHSIKVSSYTVKQLLKKHGFVKRKAQKTLSTGDTKNRNEQFLNISDLISEYKKAGNPIVSIDTKKKEKLGNLYREGKLECTEVIEVFDHDFPHLADGTVVPYTIYDICSNEAFVNIGTSKDTAEFVCDSIKIWWEKVGKKRYPNADSILFLADSGGTNSSRHHLFKQSLQNLSNDTKLDLRIAHYPPYTSKWNPVEHQVFPHITRALSGVILKSVELVQELINSAKTKTGLRVFSQISTKVYETGKKVAKNFYETANIIFDEKLEKLNYVVMPNI